MIRLFLSFVFLFPALFSYSLESSTLNPDQFKNPTGQYRPLQIIHGFDGIIAAKYPGHPLAKEFLKELVQNPDKKEFPALKTSLHDALQELRDAGLGGVVCNISFQDYLTDENQWKLFETGIECCRELGLRVWIYDEEGYPSGSAGGQVLKKNPDFEAQELILDPSSATGYHIRPAYEGTHASNNYHKARRYVNLMDKEAGQAFIDVTHQAYARHIKKDFGKTIEAFFTDEPSLIACNLGQLPEEVRKSVLVADPIDTTIPLMPAIPWVKDLPDQFRKTYNYDIFSKLKSLFSGTAKEDQQVRRDFWALVSTLVENRYFGAIEEWCKPQGVASSGHILWEEALHYYTPLNGNPLRNLQRMNIPGIDVLSSNPSSAFGGYTVTAILANSAAELNGARRIMSETSDFSEQMAHHPASLAEMQATAAWQFALGITDLTLYYTRASKTPAEYKQYCDYAGRLGELLTPARQNPQTAVYFPIYDLWAWYTPFKDPIRREMLPEKLQDIIRSFNETCIELARKGIPFCLVDYNHLANAKIENKTIKTGSLSFQTLIMPITDTVPQSAQKTIDAFTASGGKILASGKEPHKELASLQSLFQVETNQSGCLWSPYERGNKKILLFVNTTKSDWKGSVALQDAVTVQQYNFQDGAINNLPLDSKKPVEITLKPFESIALVLQDK